MSRLYLMVVFMVAAAVALAPPPVTAPGPDGRRRLDAAQNIVGRSGPAGDLEQRHPDAIGASRRAGGPGVSDGRRGGAARAGSHRSKRSSGGPTLSTDRSRPLRQRRPGGGRGARLLQQLLARARHDGRPDASHVADRGSTKRPAAYPDTERATQDQFARTCDAARHPARSVAGRLMGAARPWGPVHLVSWRPVAGRAIRSSSRPPTSATRPSSGRFNLDLTEGLHVIERFTRVGPDGSGQVSISSGRGSTCDGFFLHCHVCPAGPNPTLISAPAFIVPSHS